MTVTGAPDAALVREMVDLRVWAVVGASNDRSKYGHRVFMALRSSGYIVYPVNPNQGEVAGVPCYPSVSALPTLPDVVDLVVPPEVGLEVVRECAAAGVERVWFQPGAESPAAIALARELGLKVVHHACAIVERKRRWEEPAEGSVPSA
jgi:uncharacterized protein